MATVLVRPTNGVSFGAKHTITATDREDGYVIFDFQVDYELAAVVMVGSSAGVLDDPESFTVTYPAAGQVRIDGHSELGAAGDIISVIANRAYGATNPY